MLSKRGKTMIGKCFGCGQTECVCVPFGTSPVKGAYFAEMPCRILTPLKLARELKYRENVMKMKLMDEMERNEEKS